MSEQKFDLFMCCLGNGITICNKAVMSGGDYKQIGHISNAGNIKYYVPENYIPDDALQRIRKTANQNRREFISKANACKKDLQQLYFLYDRMLECLSPRELINHIKDTRGLSVNECVDNLWSLYLARN